MHAHRIPPLKFAASWTVDQDDLQRKRSETLHRFLFEVQKVMGTHQARIEALPASVLSLDYTFDYPDGVDRIDVYGFNKQGKKEKIFKFYRQTAFWTALNDSCMNFMLPIHQLIKCLTFNSKPYALQTESIDAFVSKVITQLEKTDPK